jgi:chaperonin GroEL
MSRQVLSGTEIRPAIMRGVNILADTVTATLGPKGRCIILERNPMWPPITTKDGITVAREVRDLADPFENAGAQLIRQAAMATSDVAGDGTTTSTLLAQRICHKGMAALDAGSNAVAIKRGIDKAVAVVVEHIKKIARPVENNETIARVGTVASNGDSIIGNLIAEAMEKVGKDGIITIADSNNSETTISHHNGMQFDRGWFHKAFIDDAEKLRTTLENPYILITDEKMYTLTEDATPELQRVISEILPSKRPLLVIASDFDGPFISIMVAARLNGVLRSVIVKAPSFGDHQTGLLEDLAIITGGFAFVGGCGRKVKDIVLDDLGQADEVIIGQSSTTFIGGKGDPYEKELRIKLLQALAENMENQFEKERLKLRVSNLSLGAAVIKVGAITDAERQEKRDRVDDAVCATKAAVEEGIVPGGGLALLQCGGVLCDLRNATPEGDEQTGVEIILGVLAAPLIQICANAGEDGDAVVAKVLQNLVDEDGHCGYDAATGEYGNLVERGIIDPAKVVRCALQNAASVAALILTTGGMVATIPEKRP